MNAMPPAGDVPRDGNLKPRSRWWYLWSVFGNGIIIYFALRYDDERVAKRCLIIAFVSFPIYFVIVGILVVAAAAADGAYAPTW